MVKSNSVRISSPACCVRILLLFVILGLSYEFAALADLSPPAFLTAVSDQDGEVPLFWFCPHPDTLDIACHSGAMSTRFYVSAIWQENCVAVRMASPVSPFLLTKSRVYVPHQGLPLDPGYDFRAPFFVTINQDSSGLPRNPFLDSVLTSAAESKSPSQGQWVNIEHNVLVRDSVFWIVFHWLEGSSLSPLVGMDDEPNTGSSFWGMRTFFHFHWHPAYHNAMIEAEIAINPTVQSDLDSFWVYRSDDPDTVIYQDNLIASLPGDQFHYADSEVVEEQSYFYRVTCFDSSWQSKASDTAGAIPKREAVLEADKEGFSVYTTAGQQVFDDLTLTHSGGLPLEFRIQVSLEEKDWMRGSDAFGCAWTDNDIAQGLEFHWANIESAGVRIGETGDDNQEYGFFDLGFSFPFYGETFDSLRITSDGWLSFSDVIPCSTDTFRWYLNHPLPWLWGPYSLVAPFWDDLKLVDSSAIYFCSCGDSAIMSCVNMHHYGQSERGPYTFQTILTPDGGITFQYLHIDDSDYSATVGIQNYDGTLGLGISCNQEYLQDSLAIKIRPSWVRIDSMEGCILPGESRTLNLIFEPLSYPRGVYHADLLIAGWDKNHQLETKIIPLTFCIDTTTSVDWTDDAKPEKGVLLRNYPNPFNPATTIQFAVVGGKGKATDHGLVLSDVEGQRTTDVSLKIYNIRGQLLRSLVNAEMAPGNYQVTWDGKDDRGKEVASGIYLCRLKSGTRQETRKLLLLK